MRSTPRVPLTNFFFVQETQSGWISVFITGDETEKKKKKKNVKGQN